MKATTNRLKGVFFICGFLPAAMQSFAQTDTAQYTLDQCLHYALQHEPTLNEAILGQSVQHASNAIALAGWLPQANASGNLTHYLQLPTQFVGNPPVKQRTGVVNTFIPNLSVTQAIFSPSLLYAAHAAPLLNTAAAQITDSSQINVVATVSKSFYALLLTLEQINVLREDTARLNKNASDTYHQYKSGLVDESDYDEASIELNNSVAQLRQAELTVTPNYATLKQSMGYPPDSNFNVSFDTSQMMRDVYFDTTRPLQYDRRIEWQQLKTAKDLQREQTRYYQSAWLPTLSSFFDYNYEFQSQTAGSLFSNAYPNSYVGLSLSIPIFTGFARVQNIHRSRLEEHILDFEQVRLTNEIYLEYASALGSYKSNFVQLDLMQKNTDLARRTYNIVALQYKQGVVPYLNVITAEENLITSEIGYLNALFQLLSSKIDLEKAMGYINTKP